jgi:Tfp pilus assembly PilM family ATPase
MPDLLAISWERKRLRVIEASVGATLRVTQGFTINVPDVSAPGWLGEALRKQGVTAKQALVCLPREDAILRLLELPDASDDELPLLVTFQASTRSATPLDQLVLDYVTLPKRVGSMQKDVLLASVPRTVSDPIRTSLKEANVELVSLTIGGFALAELLLRSDVSQRQPGDQRCLIVNQDVGRLEVTLIGDGQMLATHVVRPPVDDAGRPLVAKAAGEVSRVLVPAQPWLKEGRIDRIWLIGEGTEWSGLSEFLKSQWNCPVDRLDPHVASVLSGMDSSRLPDAPRYAHAIGLALGQVDRKTPAFDLLHPHQPKPKSDPRKLMFAVGSAAALLVAAMGTAYVQTTLAGLQSQIDKKQSVEGDLVLKLKSGEPTLAAAKIVEDWTVRDINQLKLIAELDQIMQGTERLYVADYNFTPTSGDALSKLVAKGNAKDRSDWSQVSQRLVDAKTYRLKPKELSAASRDPDYPNRFEMDVELIPTPKSTPSATKPSASSGTPVEGKGSGSPTTAKPSEKQGR